MPVTYVNSQGKRYSEAAPVAVGHFFNHQTHHRGQLHGLLTQAAVQPPRLDLHRILNP
ncbi:MAG: DinB family protein [Bryobacteraceae bacterium]